MSTFTAYHNKTIADMSAEEFSSFLAQANETKRRMAELAKPAVTSSGSSIGSSGGSSSGSSTASIGIGGIGGIDDITKQAKDLAQFRLGLDFQSMDKAAAHREEESANNFGRTTKLTDQTKTWERLINKDTQDAMTQRNTDIANKEKDMQNTGINQENFAAKRAIGLASRRLGG